MGRMLACLSLELICLLQSSKSPWETQILHLCASTEAVYDKIWENRTTFDTVIIEMADTDGEDVLILPGLYPEIRFCIVDQLRYAQGSWLPNVYYFKNIDDIFAEISSNDNASPNVYDSQI